MKKIFLIRKIFFPACVAAAVWMPAMAGPYITIDRVDAETEFPKIGIYFSIHESAKTAVGQISEEQLQVYEDGFKSDYLKVQRVKEKIDLLYLIFSVDSSRSIPKKALMHIKASAREIVHRAGPEDKIAIYHFNDDVKKLNNFSSNKNELINNINRIEQQGTKTMLYNAIYDSIDLIGSVKGTRKAIVVFTDGKDEGSGVTSDDIIKFSRETGIPVYVITIPGAKDVKIMSRIAKMTGGTLVFTNQPGDLHGMFTLISSTRENRYLVKYRSMLNADGGRHTVELRLKAGDVRDRESAEVLVHRFNFNFITQENALFLAVILLLVAVIALSYFYFAAKGKRKSKAPQKQPFMKPEQNATLENLMALEEKERLEEQTVLSSQDPEFSYAKAWLLEKDGPSSGEKFPMYWDEITLGRGKDNTVIIDDESVSPRHARIKKVRNAYYLFDLVSDNGTYLNGKKLIRPKLLYDWDEITMGRTRFIFRGSNSSLPS